MDGINKETFISRLKENKLNFSSIEEMVEYQLPVLQYYLSNYAKSVIVDNRQVGGKVELVDISKIELVPSVTPSALEEMNTDFEGLVRRIKEFEDEN